MNSFCRIKEWIPKKLSSHAVLALLLFNAVIFMLWALFSNIVFAHYVKNNILFIEHKYLYIWTFILLPLSISFITFIVNFIFLLKPILHLENLIRLYKTNKSLISFASAHDENCALELAFIDILNNQKISVEREFKTEILRQETELVALQSQINPHFLYNTLDSIRGYAIEQGVNLVADMTEALSKLFRSVIANSGKLIPLSEELKAVENYMKIQQFRFNSKFIYTKSIESMAILQCRIPSMSIQPIVENSIMHGLEKKAGTCKIEISAAMTQTRLIISIEDNGIGITQEKLDYLNNKLINGSSISKEESSKQHMGIALININQRIKLQFGELYGINIISTENVSTTVEIILPRLFLDLDTDLSAL